MTTQLLSISPSGEISTIRRAKGKGLDLRELGGAMTVERVSEIVWNDTEQAFCVLIKRASMNVVLTKSDFTYLGLCYEADVCKFLHAQGCGKWFAKEDIIYLEEYEDAVRLEVFFLEHEQQYQSQPVEL